MANRVKAWFGSTGSGQSELGKETRIGGLPSGFPAKEWPVTPSGEKMTFIGQFAVGADTPANLSFDIAYVFMVRTYDEEGECIHETWEADLGLTAVRFRRVSDTAPGEGPSLDEAVPIRWIEGWSWEFDSVDSLSEEEYGLLDQESEQPGWSMIKMGGGIRWWQGGHNHPRDEKGEPMRHVLSFGAGDFPALDLFFGDGNVHLFQNPCKPEEGALVWELD